MNGSDLPATFVLLHFIYGLAFFSMGLAMVLETRRVPLLAGPRTLHPFSVFFFINGIVSWVEAGILIAGREGYSFADWIFGVHFILLLISFSCLLLFSIRAMHPIDPKPHPHERYISAGLLLFYMVLVALIVIELNLSVDKRILLLHQCIRFGLAIPGAWLAALALWKVSQGSVAITNQPLRFFLQIVAICFVLFGVSQVFVFSNQYYLTNDLYQRELFDFSGFYIEMGRCLLALVMTISLIRVSQLVEDERLRQFDSAQQARVEAMLRIENELVERETMRQELLRHIVLAQEDERARIARELHDETAQFLTAFSLNLATIQNSLTGQEKVTGLLENLQNLSKAMSQGIHRMVNDLRPAQLDDLGLAAALQTLTDEKLEAGLNVRCEINGQSPRLDPVIETVIFRIAQEALTNVAKHAQTQRATLQLRVNSERVMLRVHDQGVGFDPGDKQYGKRGWGLVGMRERAESVGGVFQVFSATGEGTLIEVTIPLINAKTPGKRSETEDEHN
ncbi:MAG: sensor histidine kinase [Anaerolineales bacterium]|nr:sensor histidine kinase [Anaerolineales bacterium]